MATNQKCSYCGDKGHVFVLELMGTTRCPACAGGNIIVAEQPKPKKD